MNTINDIYIRTETPGSNEDLWLLNDLQELAIERIKFYLNRNKGIKIKSIDNKRPVGDKIEWTISTELNYRTADIGAIEELVDLFNIKLGDLN